MKIVKPFCLWFTGLSGSGKSTLAEAVRDELAKYEQRVELFDGDEIRKELSRDLGFSKEDRMLNNERIIFVAKVLRRNNVSSLVAFISPYDASRKLARERIKDLILVHVDCPIEECIKRDVKGLYKKALAGEIKGFTGVDDPYEAPEDAEVVVHTDEECIEGSVEEVLGHLKSNGYLE